MTPTARSGAQPGIDRAIFNFLCRYYAAHGYAPTMHEIQRALQLSGTSFVQRHLIAIARTGRIRLAPNIARGIVIVERDEGY
jgi:SOS-response transcriptional repressor LexA